MGNRGGGSLPGQTHAVPLLRLRRRWRPRPVRLPMTATACTCTGNDATSEAVRFTPVARELGIDLAGLLDGLRRWRLRRRRPTSTYSPPTSDSTRCCRRPVERPRGNCEYVGRFSWGTCAHYLLRNGRQRQPLGCRALHRRNPQPVDAARIPRPFSLRYGAPCPNRACRLRLRVRRDLLRLRQRRLSGTYTGSAPR